MRQFQKIDLFHKPIVFNPYILEAINTSINL